MGSIWGAGVYGLSAAGRARFGDHPDVVAEDLFVDQCFDADEIDIVGDEPVVVVAPAHYRDLLKVMRRAYRGAAENRVATEQRHAQDSGAPVRRRPHRRPCVTYCGSAAACPASSTPPRTPSWPSPPGSTSRSAARHAGSGTRAPALRRRSVELMCGICGIWSGADRRVRRRANERHARDHRPPRPGRRGAARPARPRPRDAPAGDHRPGGRRPADLQRGRLGRGRLQRRDLQLPRAARRARAPGPPLRHPLRHRGARPRL